MPRIMSIPKTPILKFYYPAIPALPAGLPSRALLLIMARYGYCRVGIEKVTLEVYPDNEAGIALYRKFGFHEEGRLVRQSKKTFGYQDEVIMSRWLLAGEFQE